MLEQDKKNKLSNLIKAEAQRLGFLDCGISQVNKLEFEESYLKQWLGKGYNANMDYMSNNLEKRLNPSLLVENSKSVISLSLNYFPGELTYKTNSPKISKYALGRDYHKVMKKMLKQLFLYIQTLENGLEGRFFVDSAPVLDKAWARESGMGWIGKHGLLINKDKGSFFFIGEIICNLELEYDSPVSSFCGTCTKCIEACPTSAIVEPFTLDSNLCISYQTIENKEAIPNNIITNIENNIFGCDICQDVCPWNRKSVITNISDFATRKDLLNLSFDEILAFSDDEFDNTFNGTPLKRAGRLKLQQTVQQIKNSQA